MSEFGSEALTTSMSDLTIGQLLRQACEKHPDAVAVICDHEQLSKTFRQLDTDATILADYLRTDLGLQNGDNVAIVSGACYNHVVTVLACTRAGLLLWLLDPKWTPKEVDDMLDLSESKLLIIPSSRSTQLAVYEHMAHMIDGAILANRRLLFLDGIDENSVQNLLLEAQDRQVAVNWKVNPKDGAVVSMTSGSTGFPKAVVWSHFGFVNSLALYAQLKLRQDDRICIPLGSRTPFFICGLAVGLSYGATVVIPSYHYSSRRTAHALSQYKCTHFLCVPTMARDLVSLSMNNNLGVSWLRYITTSSSPFNQDLSSAIFRHIPSMIGLLNIYGCSEVTCITSEMTTRSCFVRHVGSTTKGAIIRLLDERKQLVPIGTVGQVYAKCPWAMMGYYTKSGIDRSCFDKDGWYCLGDLGHFDAKGNFYLTGRSSDTINRGGFKYYPAEIEKTIMSHADVVRAIVVGVDDVRLGQEVAAFVQIQIDSKISVHTLLDHMRENISQQKVPKYVKLSTEAPPALSNGKLDKLRLKKQLQEMAARMNA